MKHGSFVETRFIAHMREGLYIPFLQIILHIYLLKVENVHILGRVILF